MPWLTITDPVALAEMIRSLIDTYQHEGWLPDCRMTLSKGYTQGGSNADNVLGDAFLKNITAGIDWQLGYEAVVQDAEVEPYDWCCEGRGGLDSWHNLGYIPVEDYDPNGFGTMTRSVSRTLEYSYNDFVIAQIASKLGGKSDDVQKYMTRSGNWMNLFNAEQESFFLNANGSSNGTDTGFKGFFEPKYLNRTWGYQVCYSSFTMNCVLVESRGKMRRSNNTFVRGLHVCRILCIAAISILSRVAVRYKTTPLRPSKVVYGNMACKLLGSP